MASTPAIPAPAPTPQMPVANDPAAQMAYQKAQMSLWGKTGREATNLDPTNAGTKNQNPYGGTWMSSQLGK